MNGIRVRYAPSPTGHLHVGSLRTALYNWLFARHNKGKFLVRIEDTDLERSKPEYTQSILESLSWASLEPDEPPVIQSEFADKHRKVARGLLAQGKVYRCFCSPEELRARLGESAEQEGSYTRYDEKCRHREPTPDDESLPYALRFKLPHDRLTISFVDLIRGPITFERNQLDDFIIVRSDGTPMYNFVVVVDDAAQDITHILRGEDHISNTPKQILLYEACGYPIPAFAHFSLILGPDGHRLSKRHGATAVLDFKLRGFLADALCNYLVRLGWSHGDQEIFSREELITYFTLDHMSKKQAIFDSKKLEWVNSMYIRALPPEKLVEYIERDVEPDFAAQITNWSHPTLYRIIGLYQERVKTLRELADEMKQLHNRLQEFAQDLTGYKQPGVLEYLEAFDTALENDAEVTVESVDHLLKALCEKYNIKIAQLAQPLRIALTGQTSSPGVAQLIAALGKEESIQRIGYFIAYLKEST